MNITEEDKSFFNHNGFLIKSGVLSKRQLSDIKNVVHTLANNEAATANADFYRPDSTGKTQRVWNLTNKGTIFQKLLENEVIENFMEFIFDRNTHHQKYFLSSFQANILHPGCNRQRLHIDTPVPEPLPEWPIKANSIWMIDDFTDSNGATELCAGSHREKFKPNMTDDKEAITTKAIAPAGSVLFTHGALWHRAGANISKKSRVALLGSFAASYALEIAREEDQSVILNQQLVEKMSPKLKRIIGIGHGIKHGAKLFPPSE